MDPAVKSIKVEGIKSAIRCINPRTRPHDSRIDSLPDDLLLQILVRISAQDIHENARCVCRRWKRLVHGDTFVDAHLHRTSYGLLLPNFMGAPTVMVTAALGGIEISRVSSLNRLTIFGSCNGLILGIIYSRENSIYIVNPATNWGFNLSRFFGTKSGFKPELGEFGIAYAAASMEYKVVAAYVNDSDSTLSQYAILTVGVDNAWRDVMIEELSPRAKEFLLNYYDMLSTEGFVHWVSATENYVLTMNVETETIAETPTPIEYQVEGCNYVYLSTGRHLSVLISCGVLSWEVWEMKGETGEWRKLVNEIDLKAHKCRIPQIYHECLEPVGWVKYPNVLAFSFRWGRSCIVYNLDTDLIDSLELDSPSNRYNVAVHRSSLV